VYRNIDPPTFELVSISSPGIETDMTVRVLTSVRINNPNTISLPVRGGRLQLAINGVDVGSAVIDDDFTIPASGSEVVALPATLDLSKALQVGISTLGIGSTDINYTLDGHIDLGTRYLGRVPIDKSGSVTLGKNGR